MGSAHECSGGRPGYSCSRSKILFQDSSFSKHTGSRGKPKSPQTHFLVCDNSEVWLCNKSTPVKRPAICLFPAKLPNLWHQLADNQRMLRRRHTRNKHEATHQWHSSSKKYQEASGQDDKARGKGSSNTHLKTKGRQTSALSNALSAPSQSQLPHKKGEKEHPPIAALELAQVWTLFNQVWTLFKRVPGKATRGEEETQGGEGETKPELATTLD